MKLEKGFSLIELMVATLIGSIAVLLVGKIFIVNKHIFAAQTDLAMLQEHGRLALSFIAKDLRMAGFYGCANPTRSAVFVADQGNGASILRNFGTPLEGFDAAVDIARDHALRHDYGQASSAVLIRRAGEQGFEFITIDSDGNVLAAAKKSAKLSGGCVEGVCEGQQVTLSDCAKHVVFTVKKLKVESLSQYAQVTLTPDTPLATIGQFNQQFSQGDIYPLESIGYFVADGSAGFPTLWQKKSREAVFEILEGVEQLSMTYRLAGGSQYRSAAQLIDADWEKVNGVKLDILMRSHTANTMGDAQVYEWQGQTINATDGYLRQVFSTVVALRGAIE